MEEKRTAGAALLEQVMAENAVMIERKKLEKAREVEEDLRILAYIQEQDAKALVSNLYTHCIQREECQCSPSSCKFLAFPNKIVG